MRLTPLVSAAVVAIALVAATSSMHASGKSSAVAVKAASPESSAPAAAPKQFVTLKGVNVVPMSSRELVTVKGRHVHFLDANGGFHLAGNPELQNNWQNLGGSDGKPVAPSYHGLCVAQGISPTGGITIPGAAVQCP